MFFVWQVEGISTHAPRTGSDISRSFLSVLQVDFNPRSPHGERQPLLKIPDNCIIISTHAPRTGSDLTYKPNQGFVRDFNPRSPHGERLYLSAPVHWTSPFQPTLPARGATAFKFPAANRYGYFNPRSPHGERRSSFKCFPISSISTHAPRTGSDPKKVVS